MHYIRVLLIISIFCFWIILSSFQLLNDSIYERINQASGKDKLELIYRSVVSYQDSKEALTFGELLRIESEKQEDWDYFIKSYMAKAKYYIYENNADSILYYSRVIEDIATEKGLDNSAAYCYIAYFYINSGYYDLAIHTLNKWLHKGQIGVNPMRDPAIYELLGHAYFSSKNFELAKENFEQALLVCTELNPEDVYSQMGYYLSLISSLSYLNDKDMALLKCAELENLLKTNQSKITAYQYRLMTLLLYNEYAYIYVSLEDIVKTKYYLDKIELISMDGIPDVYRYTANVTKAKYYILLHQYDKSLANINEALEFCKNNDLNGNFYFMELSLLKVEALDRLGDYKGVINLQSSIIHYNDSISRKNIPLQISQLSKKNELDKAKIEAEKDKMKLERVQILIIALTIILLLLIVILYLMLRYVKKKKEKNLILYKRNQEFDDYLKKKIVSQSSNNGQEAPLFERIEAYILEHEVFKNPNLIRDDLSAALNTNRQYLTDAIKQETGKAFLDYINQFRLSYAYHLLVLSNDSVSINSIIFESSFSSSSTFYRLFKEKFGMTPNEVRQVKSEIASR